MSRHRLVLETDSQDGLAFLQSIKLEVEERPNRGVYVIVSPAVEFTGRSALADLQIVSYRLAGCPGETATDAFNCLTRELPPEDCCSTCLMHRAMERSCV